MSASGKGPTSIADTPRVSGEPPNGAAVTRTRRSRLRPRNWRVRAKFGAVVIAPTVAFLVVGGTQAVATVRGAVATDRFTQRIALARPVTALVHEVQRERDHSVGYVAAMANGATHAQITTIAVGLTADQRAVDQAAGRLRQAIRSHPKLARQSTFDARTVLSTLDGMAELRAAVKTRSLRHQVVFGEYTQIVTAALQLLPPQTAPGAEDPSTAARATVTQLAQVEELDAQIRGSLYAITYAHGFDYGEFRDLTNLLAQRSLGVDRFYSTATPAERFRYQNTVKGQAVLVKMRMEETAISEAPGAELQIDPEQWWAASTTNLELERAAENSLLTDAIANAKRLNSASWQYAALAITEITVILLIVLGTVVTIGRSMGRSLLRLRRQALEVAYLRLPNAVRQLLDSSTASSPVQIAPTSVGSADEIGEVAAAFDVVHQEAVRLAVEQVVLRRNASAIFANLARRGQLLLGRQLEFIDRLEQDELDPDRLATLFKIDHLATRMRRHDENLLVLSDIEPSRMGPKSTSISNVLRAAAAEIEDYPRVHCETHKDIEVLGYAVPDLIHLLAELMENATVFSPPSTPVRADVRRIGGGDAIVAIEDNGIGMSANALATANATLLGMPTEPLDTENGMSRLPAALNVSASERMGLYVVSRLAARHSIRVELHSPDTPGLIAYVWLPAGLLVPASEPHKESGGPSGPGRSSDAAGKTTARRPFVTNAARPARTPMTGPAGLPLRSPMTRLRRPEPLPDTGTSDAPVRLDPDQVRSALFDFYHGIQRAETDHGSARGSSTDAGQQVDDLDRGATLT